MENATSYTLTFTQGSGANVAILAGETKMIATDGLVLVRWSTMF